MIADHGDRNWGSSNRRPPAARVRPEEHAALVDGRPLSLTMRELQLLVTLASHPQRIMTREELFAEVWGSEPRREDRSVDVYISRLRAKLGQALPGRAADPHPQRHRLPLLAGRLSSGDRAPRAGLLHLFYILDTGR